MKKLLGLLTVSVLAVLAPIMVKAQQDAMLTQYMFNTLFYNPGYAGLDGFAKFSLLYRDQWTGYGADLDPGGAPKTTIFSFHAPLLRYQSGAGMYIMHDQLGPQNNIDAQLSYAYHLELAKGKLSLGLRTGVYAQTLDWDLYRAIHVDDPVLKFGKETQMKPDLSLGAFYQKKNYYAGISVSHLIQSEFDFGVDNIENPIRRHAYVTGGYHYEVNYDFTITPSTLIKTDFNKYQVDLSVLATYKKQFWGGLAYRSEESASVLIGANVLKSQLLSIGYAFDYVVPASVAKRPTSHEVMLAYSLPVTLKGSKPIIRTPRYRK